MHRKSTISIRVATAQDRPQIAAVVNAAFAIEKFLVGPRTDEDQLTRMMQKGLFLLARDSAGNLLASVYVEVRGSRGYLGMLAVDPSHQGQGLGRIMVEAAENFCRDQGCASMDLTTLNLRPELPPFYRKLGYEETGIEEFRPSRPFREAVECHCIVMSKAL